MKVLTNYEFDLFLGLVKVGTRKDIAANPIFGLVAVIDVTTIFVSVCDHVDTIDVAVLAQVGAIRQVF